MCVNPARVKIFEMQFMTFSYRSPAQCFPDVKVSPERRPKNSLGWQRKKGKRTTGQNMKHPFERNRGGEREGGV